MKIIQPEELTNKFHIEIIKTEHHHGHQIFEDQYGIIRWVPDIEYINSIIYKKVNDVVKEMLQRGLDKNCEEYRKVYRYIGYSLIGYWDIFYWNFNNPISHLYHPEEK